MIASEAHGISGWGVYTVAHLRALTGFSQNHMSRVIRRAVREGKATRYSRLGGRGGSYSQVHLLCTIEELVGRAPACRIRFGRCVVCGVVFSLHGEGHRLSCERHRAVASAHTSFLRHRAKLFGGSVQ